jgi:hypothetical protein
MAPFRVKATDLPRNAGDGFVPSAARVGDGSSWFLLYQDWMPIPTAAHVDYVPPEEE